MATDLTIEILREIRDGIQDLRQDFNTRLDQTNKRLDETKANRQPMVCWGGHC